ncbi:MAG: hypothetical protein ACI9G1_001322 [Pirellulaceae bacterium]|jgi:hypothetical protein
MPAYTLLSLSNVNLAIATVANIRGVYQSIGLLSKALTDVEEAAGFKNEVRQLENEHGPLYQGPDNSRATVLKAAKTAANGDSEQQKTMAKLVALIIERFGTSQGTRLLGFLLMAAGYDPTLILFVVRTCSFLARTEAGKKVLEQAQPQLVKLAEATGQTKLFTPFIDAVQSAGAESATWAKTVVSATSSSVRKASSIAAKATQNVGGAAQSGLNSLINNLQAADEKTELASSGPSRDSRHSTNKSASTETSSHPEYHSSRFTSKSITPIWDQPRAEASSESATERRNSSSERSQPPESESEPVSAEPHLADQEPNDEGYRNNPPRERSLVRKPTRRMLDDDLDDILILDDVTVGDVVPLRKSNHEVVPLKREHEIVDAEIIFLEE